MYTFIIFTQFLQQNFCKIRNQICNFKSIRIFSVLLNGIVPFSSYWGSELDSLPFAQTVSQIINCPVPSNWVFEGRDFIEPNYCQSDSIKLNMSILSSLDYTGTIKHIDFLVIYTNRERIAMRRDFNGGLRKMFNDGH